MTEAPLHGTKRVTLRGMIDRADYEHTSQHTRERHGTQKEQHSPMPMVGAKVLLQNGVCAVRVDCRAYQSYQNVCVNDACAKNGYFVNSTYAFGIFI